MLGQSSINKKGIIDRFIHSRVSRNLGLESKDVNQIPDNGEVPHSYERFISKEMFNGENCNSGFKNKLYGEMMNLMGRRNINLGKQSQRTFNLTAEKILDAPDLKDDYYLNLLDWSSRGVLSIGLGDKVYLYSPSQITQLCQRTDQYICSLSSHPHGDLLSVGLSNGKIQLYDIERQQLIRTLKGHTNRVSSASFTYGNLFSGSRDSLIIAHDYRAHHNVTMKLEGHRGEVCGLQHDACGLASGSNDNLALIWDLAMGKQRFQLHGHKAAVKALSWCPWQRNLLATGGGSSDKTMRFWNIETGKIINVVNTESQVCSLVWNKNQRQILSSHGYSQNQLCIWRYPDCSKLVQLHGHTQRVLHMKLSPDNSTICTASADQTLRFWKLSSTFSPHIQDKYDWKLNPKYYHLR